MTNPTPHGQVPEALRLADALERPGYGWHTTPAQCAAVLRRLHAENEALRTQQPAPAPLSERDAFEVAWEKLHGKRPVLWSRVFAEHKMETPSHSEGKYFARDEQAAWKLWQARAALAAQGGKDA